MTTNTATTREQSLRLLQCGVDPKTADMVWTHFESDDEQYERLDVMSEDAYEVSSLKPVPAWSLSALLPMLPYKIEIDEDPYAEIQEYGLLIYPFMGGWQVDYQYCENDECHCLKCIHSTGIIEACVQTIEWLTANNYKLNQL